jgi:hypothetical protein
MKMKRIDYTRNKGTEYNKIIALIIIIFIIILILIILIIIN